MVWGNLGTGYWLGGAAGGAPHWQELGRTTLGSAGDTINVSSLTAKPYLMVLHHCINSGNIYPNMQFNSDTSSNYAYRFSSDGGADTTATNATFYRSGGSIGSSVNQYSVMFINNTSSKEKLITNHFTINRTAGAGTAPFREENVGKWANTTNQITSVQVNNGQTGDFATGSEVVVLGYDPADTTGTSVWAELASVELTSSNSVLDSGTFTAKKYLWVQAFINPVASENLNQAVRFNDDTGSNYARRTSGNGGADTTTTSATSIHGAAIEGDQPKFMNYFIINKSDKEKLVIRHDTAQNTAGAGNAPARSETVGKWANTSAQITSTEIINLNGGTSFASGSLIKVWGFD